MNEEMVAKARACGMNDAEIARMQFQAAGVITCRTCKEIKPFADYYKALNGATGYRLDCKVCIKEQGTARREQNNNSIACRTCKEVKSCADFSKSPTHTTGYRPDCRDCMKNQGVARREQYKGTSKVCLTCKLTKDRTEFYPATTSRDGSDVNCKVCSKQTSAIWQREKHTFMSQEEYDIKFAAQNGICAKCDREPIYNQLHADHNHRTSQKRGLLCFGCNSHLIDTADDYTKSLRDVSYKTTYLDDTEITEDNIEYMEECERILHDKLAAIYAAVAVVEPSSTPDSGSCLPS